MKIGFIGCGNMGRAMLSGIIKSNIMSYNDIIASSKTKETLKNLEEDFNIRTTLDNREVVKFSEIIILAVKPNMYETVIKGIKDLVSEDKIIVTIAAGVTIEDVIKWFNKSIKIVKTMPNTPALVGEAMTAMCTNKEVSQEEKEKVISIFKGFGRVEMLEEKDFHAFIALCGSSPAYIFMLIEAMADGAVKQGIPRKKAYRLASQAVFGSAKMVLETGLHPGELKDMVCSPGGTTIEAVSELEKSAFRATIINAMDKCEQKSKKIQDKN